MYVLLHYILPLIYFSTNRTCGCRNVFYKDGRFFLQHTTLQLLICCFSVQLLSDKLDSNSFQGSTMTSYAHQNMRHNEQHNAQDSALIIQMMGSLLFSKNGTFNTHARIADAYFLFQKILYFE
jgi:hypothetical protein